MYTRAAMKKRLIIQERIMKAKKRINGAVYAVVAK
jgi:hypothetical protein